MIKYLLPFLLLGCVTEEPFRIDAYAATAKHREFRCRGIADVVWREMDRDRTKWHNKYGSHLAISIPNHCRTKYTPACEQAEIEHCILEDLIDGPKL